MNAAHHRCYCYCCCWWWWWCRWRSHWRWKQYVGGRLASRIGHPQHSRENYRLLVIKIKLKFHVFHNVADIQFICYFRYQQFSDIVNSFSFRFFFSWCICLCVQFRHWWSTVASFFSVLIERSIVARHSQMSSILNGLKIVTFYGIMSVALWNVTLVYVTNNGQMARFQTS